MEYCGDLYLFAGVLFAVAKKLGRFMPIPDKSCFALKTEEGLVLVSQAEAQKHKKFHISWKNSEHIRSLCLTYRQKYLVEFIERNYPEFPDGSN